MIMQLKEILCSSRNTVFFGGAGVSTESGIPDFRSASGLYSAEAVYGFPPEEMLSLEFFLANTETFYQYYRSNLIHLDAAPGPAHLALACLEQQGRLQAVVTQNIDGLHQQAGSRSVHELHGSIHRNYCLDCGAGYPLDEIVHPQQSRGSVPLCLSCGGIIRPDVVLYGEPLDRGVMDAAVRAVGSADVLVVGGTSLAVYPAAGLLHHLPPGGALVLLNKTATGFDSRANLVIHDSLGPVLTRVLELMQ